jgi:hypothetical protein
VHTATRYLATARSETSVCKRAPASQSRAEALQAELVSAQSRLREETLPPAKGVTLLLAMAVLLFACRLLGTGYPRTGYPCCYFGLHRDVSGISHRCLTLQFVLVMLQEIRCSAAHHRNFADIVVIIRSEARMCGQKRKHVGTVRANSTLSVNQGGCLKFCDCLG